ncbi:MAG: hypothetical protein HRT36_09255 [Alphaproteobacteria bacterium]|nr:hypothetical protein [Alphaproteobacteria bacterium]
MNETKAIAQRLKTFNNSTAGKVATDKQARFDCKGKNVHWYDYQETRQYCQPTLADVSDA